MRFVAALLSLALYGCCCVPIDTFGTDSGADICVDRDGDGVETCVGARGDCNDFSATITTIYLGSETCNGIDDDCDGVIDDGVGFRPDADLDGHGDESVVRCRAEAGDITTSWDDCDDTNPDVYFNHPELCDGVDNNCNSAIDENAALYPDVDGDGYGDSDLASCTEGSTSVGGDCDDTDPAVHPDAAERCNTVDDDCDGTIDGAATLWPDADADGWGVEPSTTVDVCTTGYAPSSGDCDDTDEATFPGAPETCEDVTDRNCDGSVGSDDGDRDGSPACEDCNDAAWYIYPGATETCGNGLDDNCDGTIDEGC